MALCRRRGTGKRLLAVISVCWVVLLLMLLVNQQRVKLPLPDSRLEVSRSVGITARQNIPETLNSGHGRLVSMQAPQAPEPFPIPHTITPPSRRKPTTRSQRGPGGGDARMFLLPPQQPDGPGEMGKPVILPVNLTKEQQTLVDAGWKANAFNQYVSDMISLHRKLPDVRDDRCQGRRDWGHLPDTGVVVCFHNEAWSVLLRTMHSILDRSPQRPLKELILVDDFSDRDHLKAPLDQYVAQFPKVKVVRTNKREGLIRARLIGARYVTAQVVTFLDSHCECTEGWLEPLLERIGSNTTTVVTPVIDTIHDVTFEYQYDKTGYPSVGGFDWMLQFRWHSLPDRDKPKHRSDPVPTPTMAGGLFAIDKNWFERLGTYDEGFDIWGSENLELSFKTWMCGGQLETVTCSHVGHIFRRRSPYKWKSGEDVLRKNSLRLAEVWLDDYKKYYYERIGTDAVSYGDISSRKALRRRLKCKTFQWYLTEIYPDIFIPGDAVASGEIRNLATNMCLDSPLTNEFLYKPVGVYPCHLLGGNEYFLLSKAGEIRRDTTCLDYSGGDVVSYPCHGSRGNQWWTYNLSTRLLLHEVAQLCMTISEDNKKPVMEKCDENNKRQHWLFQNYNATKLL